MREVKALVFLSWDVSCMTMSNNSLKLILDEVIDATLSFDEGSLYPLKRTLKPTTSMEVNRLEVE